MWDVMRRTENWVRLCQVLGMTGTGRSLVVVALPYMMPRRARIE